MRSISYRGHEIRYHCTSRWFAIIRPEKYRLAHGGKPTPATREEGKTVLLVRAKARIDRDIENSAKILAANARTSQVLDWRREP